MKSSHFTLAFMVIAATLLGCGEKPQPAGPKVGAATTSKDPANALLTFTLATSEYPSWSTFMVARKAGLIGKDDGEPGILEKKWGVRVKLEVKDYDPCLQNFGSKTVDAVCMTNIDSLNPALGRPCTAIMPTSTSRGADKWIALNAKTIDEMEGVKTYGLAKSVSEYVFVRALEKAGKDRSKFPFENLDPAAAATAFQTGSKDVTAIMVWNPFALQAMRSNKNATDIADSTATPEEVIDMVVVGNDVLQREKGDMFACLLCDIFYNVCSKMTDDPSSDKVFKALGEDFSHLDIADMRICCKETAFYATSQDGIKLFSNSNFQNNSMPKVVQTCKEIGILTGDPPTIGWNDPSKQLNFSTEYMDRATSKK